MEYTIGYWSNFASHALIEWRKNIERITLIMGH